MRYAAFLRAVNLGRNRRVTGAELKALFEEAGAEDVATFRTSGNVVYGAPRDMTSELESHLEAALGHEVVIFTRTAKEVQAIAAYRPFSQAELDATEGRLQVSLLLSKPEPALRKKVLALATDDDRLAFHERELYWLPRAGTQTSELDSGAIETLLGRSTMRTMGTIEQLAARFFA